MPEPLAQEPTRLQRTNADGSVKHADEFWVGVEVQEADVQGVPLTVQVRYAVNVWAPNPGEEEDMMLGTNFWAIRLFP